MFNSISWQAYWTAIALISAVYYSIVLLLYFRKGLSVSLSKENLKGRSHSSITSTTGDLSGSRENEGDFTPPEIGSAEHLVYACVDEINAFIQEAKRIKTGKQEFLAAIKAILQKYPTISATEYRDAISKVVVSEAVHHCSIHLSEAEVDSVWLG